MMGPAIDPNDARQRSFLRAAAVLWEFGPDQLQPADGPPAQPGEAARLLRGHVVSLRSRTGERWTLRDALRPDLLRGCTLEELLALRRRNPAQGGDAQTIVDLWLAGPDPDLGTYDLEKLAVMLRLRGWLDPAPAHFPTADDLQRRRGGAAFRAPLRQLAGDDFCGREQELDQLRLFVFDPTSGPGPLVIVGIGGTGKSTLAARLLLELSDGRFPEHVLAYLDFDVPTVDVADGVTLIREIIVQGAALRPDVPRLHTLADAAAQTTIELGAGRGRAAGRAEAVRESMTELAARYGDALRAAAITRTTVVLDTFEEIQFADADHQRHLAEQIAALDGALPGLRTIVVSRAPLDLAGAIELRVDGLDDASARALVAKQGIVAPEVVTEILDLAQGNPLNLKLACALIKRDGRDALAALRRGAVDDGLIQGQLYQRILDHIHDKRIQKLAHPGLVVRRITPEILREELSEPCGLAPLDEAAAQALFDLLAREISLVRLADDGALEHRPDVRRVMLDLLYRDRPQVARRLHVAAADYYRVRDGEIAIAEEAYHCFALGWLSGPWLERLEASPAAAARLRTALEELPEACWPTLASLAGIDLPPERWERADVASRERRLAARLERLWTSDRADEIAELLDAQPPSQARSPLWRWQGRALAVLGRNQEALAALERSLATMLGPPEETDEDLRRAIEVATKLGDRAALARLTAPAAAPPSHTRTVARSLAAAAEPEMATAGGWLDDQQLRALIHRALDASKKDEDDFKIVHEAPARAASTYAKVLELNQAAPSPDGSVPLLTWVEAHHDLPRDAVEEVKSAVSHRLRRPKRTL